MSTKAYIQKHPPKRRRRFSYPKLALEEKKAAWISRAIFLLMPLLSFTLVEVLNYNNPWTEFTPLQIALNLVWYYFGELFFYFLRGRRSGGIKWGLGIAWGFGMASHYLISFRGRTLFPSDFLSIGTAANVVGNYDFTPDRKQVITGLIMVACVLLVAMLPDEPRKKFSWKLFLPAAGAAAVFLGIFFGTGFLQWAGIEPSLWTTRGNGLFLNFSVCLRYSRVEKPAGYSKASLKALAGQTPSASASAMAEGTQPVNLIVIMNEAYGDLTVLPGVESSQDAMPFYRSLTENAIKGYAYSSVFGGTTANSEYEFLTGNTTAFLPPSTVPYQMYVTRGDPTLVSQLKALGYRCEAAHPYYSSGWNRVPVYQDFGFDAMHFERDFQNRAYLRGDAGSGYISDRCDYENLVRMYEEKAPGEKLFLFNVTMQNHSAYNMPWTGLERTVWLEGDLKGRFSTVDQYFSLIYESDRALEYLIGYFSQVEEPTMIVLFGDHQPQVATNFYTDVLGEAPELALAQKKQMVPFLIWANYDIPEAQGVELSLNYLAALAAETANLPLTGYQQFLLELRQELPVINAVGIRDSGGNWYELDGELPGPLAGELLDYQKLLYSNIFDKRHRPGDFFTLAK